jgi:hypothetical protein
MSAMRWRISWEISTTASGHRSVGVANAGFVVDSGVLPLLFSIFISFSLMWETTTLHKPCQLECYRPKDLASEKKQEELDPEGQGRNDPHR